MRVLAPTLSELTEDPLSPHNVVIAEQRPGSTTRELGSARYAWAIRGRLGGRSTLANSGCSPNHLGKERTRWSGASSSMARLLSAAPRSRSPTHTAVSV